MDTVKPGNATGSIRAFFDDKEGNVIQVDFFFFSLEEFQGIVRRIKSQPGWNFQNPTRQANGRIDLIPKADDFPYNCPIHQNQNIQPNRKNGDHTHYCAVKIGNNKWCGEKIYRYDE